MIAQIKYFMLLLNENEERVMSQRGSENGGGSNGVRSR
jgi:hypothetical protein